MCGANRSDNPYTDTSRRARWKATLLAWIFGARLRVSDHPVWDLIGVNRWHAPGDLMHTGCLGVLLWLLGSVLWELIFDGPFRGALEARKQRLWALIQAKYNALEIPCCYRIADIDLDRFRHAHAFAELRAKAAEARHLLPVMASLCRDLNDGSARDAHRLAALDHINSIYRIICVSSEIIPVDAHARMMQHVDSFLVQYHWLAHHSQNQGILCYHMTSKFHFLWHIIHMSQFLNPRCTWCYVFEHFIGHIIRSAAMCVAGTPMYLIGEKVCINFCITLQFDLTRCIVLVGYNKSYCDTNINDINAIKRGK